MTVLRCLAINSQISLDSGVLNRLAALAGVVSFAMQVHPFTARDRRLCFFEQAKE